MFGSRAKQHCGFINITLFLFVSDFGLVLTELCINDKENGSIKQLAAVLLRQYVDTHWSELSEKFSPPETPNHVSICDFFHRYDGITI